MHDFSQMKYSFADASQPSSATSWSITNITWSGGSAKGEWVELISSASYDFWGFNLTDANFNTNKFNIMFDIGVGPAGSEVVVLENILAGNSTSTSDSYVRSSFVPLWISRGQRISARMQCGNGVAAEFIRVGISGMTAGLMSPTPYKMSDTYGVVNASSATAVSIDPGATSGTKGAWTQLTSATAADIEYMIVSISNNNNTTIGINTIACVDIGYGSVGNETQLVGNLIYTAGANEVIRGGRYSFPCYVPRGSRLVARALSNNTDSSDRLVCVCIQGLC